jgi:sRNA-binding carbon storage regulator CsrA
MLYRDVSESDEIKIHGGLIKVYVQKLAGQVRVFIDAPKEVKIEVVKSDRLKTLRKKKDV